MSEGQESFLTSTFDVEGIDELLESAVDALLAVPVRAEGPRVVLGKRCTAVGTVDWWGECSW